MVTKLTAGLKETLGRLAGRSEEVSVGVARLLSRSDLAEPAFIADWGLRLDPCGLALPLMCCRVGVSSLHGDSMLQGSARAPRFLICL